jgi:hypothetical protein
MEFGNPKSGKKWLDRAGWGGLILLVVGMSLVAVPYFRYRVRHRAVTRPIDFSDPAFAEGDFFDSPEAAALSGWPAAAQARVLRTRFLTERRAEVLVDTVPSHPLAVFCERSDRGWIWTSDVDA